MQTCSKIAIAEAVGRTLRSYGRQGVAAVGTAFQRLSDCGDTCLCPQCQFPIAALSTRLQGAGKVGL